VPVTRPRKRPKAPRRFVARTRRSGPTRHFPGSVWGASAQFDRPRSRNRAAVGCFCVPVVPRPRRCRFLDGCVRRRAPVAACDETVRRGQCHWPGPVPGKCRTRGTIAVAAQGGGGEQGRDSRATCTSQENRADAGRRVEADGAWRVGLAPDRESGLVSLRFSRSWSSGRPARCLSPGCFRPQMRFIARRSRSQAMAMNAMLDTARTLTCQVAVVAPRIIRSSSRRMPFVTGST
jgi:hypothetical protein